MVRALASHQCDLGSIPRPGIMWVEFVVGFCYCSEGFLQVLRFSILLKNQHLNSNMIGNLRGTGWLIARLLCATLIKESPFIYF